MKQEEYPIVIVRLERLDEENYVQAAFADKDGDPENYLILQRALEPDEQDIELELAGIYSETADESLTGYDQVKQILWDGSHVQVDFGDDDETRLVLDLSAASYSAEELVNFLGLIGQDRFEDRSGSS